MKNTIVSVLQVALLASSAACAATLVKVNLPEAVIVGNVTLPAGEYLIRNWNDDAASPTLLLHSANGPDAALAVQRVAAPHHEPVTKSRVVLKQDEKGYRLDTIWVEGQDLGYRFSK